MQEGVYWEVFLKLMHVREEGKQDWVVGEVKLRCDQCDVSAEHT